MIARRNQTPVGGTAGSARTSRPERQGADAAPLEAAKEGGPSPGRSIHSIVLGRDTIVTLTRAAALIPPRRRGRKTHVSTLFRWSTVGCRGVVRPTIQCGGTRCTSLEALQEFCERLTELARRPAGEPRAVDANSWRSPSRRRRESEAAARRLEKMGA